MRVAYRMPMPTMVPRGEQDLAYNPGAECWQQFFAPHSHLTFLAEVVQDDDAIDPWQEGDWLEDWLDPHMTERETIRQLIKPVPARMITHWAVSKDANRVGNDHAELVEPINPA
ncbi:hypothetical protein [Kushneria phyllosphaerae]|uniref:Uncharacterized protein n=1 Tax=Kushneria phyllosphaerae TaxID=2100822 RepID=A0A2R8CIZ0_9GAMM|nr:hypothetical protein [Kushneria phyllosphaerae]SPJ32856.1 hypothetical protein KSP9073_00858 [Kushneria phyllosphaerae]